MTDQIKNAIADGSLNPGFRLPSVRNMVSELKISAITVKRAYADLEREGFIKTRSGLGTFVADVDAGKMREEKMLELKEEIKKIIKSGEKYKISAEDIIELIRNIMED
ncbi:MAG: GntR family transcriptional regulator [bacterium]|nr:GntR family transcriptional regulator [bacterium]